MTFKHGPNVNSADNREDEEVLSWELVSQHWQNEPDWTFQHCILFCFYSLPKPVALLAAGKFGEEIAFATEWKKNPFTIIGRVKIVDNSLTMANQIILCQCFDGWWFWLKIMTFDCK